ncbi:Obg ATPase 1 [Phytophthora cinnamomi]|uniref:Obg ATPase 1 n=1 Tax=Phytophthora cinnamomi TaxID=4785 RepID=UPI003559911A|nr:Obg ATPase 1 [Phytophthora cinnamomi]
MLLRSMLKQKSSWRLQLQRILDFEASSVSHEPQVQGISEVEIEIMDEAQAAQEFGFHPLTEQDLTQTILDNKRDISHVEHRLLLSSAPESTNDVRTHRMQAFGWDVVQRVHGGVMEFACTKRFHGLNMLDVMQKTWANGMRLDDFKKVKAETRRLQALQRINSNAYVFARDVFSPSDISTFRSVFVRFLVETAKPITPDSGPTLTGKGYMLGTESITIDCPRCLLAEDSHGRLAWASVTLSIETLDVVDHITGETYQQIRWVGRTDYCSEEHAQRNASDTIQSMLRWELLVIAPALKLTSLA